MRTGWQPTAKDQHYRRTGEVTWDCTACCLDGHPARAHNGQFNYSWGFDGKVTIHRADPCFLLNPEGLEEITKGALIPHYLRAFGHLEGELLRIEADNLTIGYRLTKQPFNNRPTGVTPSVAESIPPYGDFYLAEWPD